MCNNVASQIPCITQPNQDRYQKNPKLPFLLVNKLKNDQIKNDDSLNNVSNETAHTAMPGEHYRSIGPVEDHLGHEKYESKLVFPLLQLVAYVPCVSRQGEVQERPHA